MISVRGAVMTINRLPSGGEVGAGPAHGAGSRAPPASSRIPAALIYTLPSVSTRVSETAQVTGPRTPAHRLRRTTLPPERSRPERLGCRPGTRLRRARAMGACVCLCGLRPRARSPRTSGAMAGGLGEKGRGTAAYFLRRHILFTRRDAPLVTERVRKFAVAVAPEHVLHRHVGASSGGCGAIENGIH